MRAYVLYLLLAVGAAPALGQTVYKCTEAGGTVVFSQRPCADDPAQVETVDTSRSLKTGSGGSVAEEGEFASMNEVRRRCEQRASAIAERYVGAYRRIAQEIAALEARVAPAGSGQQGASWENGMRQQISGLVAERGTMKSAEVNEMAANRLQCQDEEKAEVSRQAAARKAREDAEAKRHAKAAPAAAPDAAGGAKSDQPGTVPVTAAPDAVAPPPVPPPATVDDKEKGSQKPPPVDDAPGGNR